jgi:hypothetical protein
VASLGVASASRRWTSALKKWPPWAPRRLKRPPRRQSAPLDALTPLKPCALHHLNSISSRFSYSLQNIDLSHCLGLKNLAKPEFSLLVLGKLADESIAAL